MKKNAKNQKKITLWVPVDLLEEALVSGGGNITETVKQGLALIAASKAYSGLARLRGKVKVSLDLSALRADRR